MNKIQRPHTPGLLFLFPILAFFMVFSGCNPQGTSTKINQDTLRNHVIPISLALQYTASYRAMMDSMEKKCPGLKDSLQFGHAESFPSDVFYALCEQSNPKQGAAVGIRIYYGRDAKGMIRLIMVPYDKNGNDMIDHLVDMGKPTAKAQSDGSGDGQTVEEGQHCPTLCDGGGSGLNGNP